MATTSDEPDSQARIAALHQGLQAAGWTIGGNVRVDVRWSGGNIALLRKHAVDLVENGSDVIVAGVGPTGPALRAATRTVPVVFAQVVDPVGNGYVASLSRPGGNATGFTPIAGSLGGKWVQLLKEIAPSVARVSLLFNPPTATFIEGYLTPFRTAAASLGMEAERPREGGAQPAGRHAEGSDIAPGQVENTVHFPPQARSAGASNSRAIFSETATP